MAPQSEAQGYAVFDRDGGLHGDPANILMLTREQYNIAEAEGNQDENLEIKQFGSNMCFAAHGGLDPLGVPARHRQKKFELPAALGKVSLPALTR